MKPRTATAYLLPLSLAVMLGLLSALVIVPSAAAQESCTCNAIQHDGRDAFSQDDCMWAKQNFVDWVNTLCLEGFCQKDIKFCGNSGCNNTLTVDNCDFVNGFYRITGFVTYSCERCYSGPFTKQASLISTEAEPTLSRTSTPEVDGPVTPACLQ